MIFVRYPCHRPARPAREFAGRRRRPAPKKDWFHEPYPDR
jgi:hypothetical protein